MTTICYVLSTLEAGGPTNQLYDTLAHLGEGFDPVVVTLSPEPDDSARSCFERLGVEMRSLDLSRAAGFVYGWSELRSVVAEVSPDVVHSHGLRADVLSSVALREYPCVSTVHTYPYADYSMLYGDLKGSVLARIHLAALRHLDAPVACSKSVWRRVEEHGVGAELVPNGVDTDRYSPPAEDRAAARRSLDVPTDGPLVVSVGAFIPRKDHETLVRGFLRSEVSEIGSLVMVSDGPLLERCRELAADHPNVRLPGRVEDVREYLAAADYFASASKGEGLPLAVLEALSSGLPVCLSDIDPHRDVLSVNPDAGVAFETGDSEALATALDSLVNADYGPRRAAARAIVTEELSARRMSERYQTLYDDLAR